MATGRFSDLDGGASGEGAIVAPAAVDAACGTFADLAPVSEMGSDEFARSAELKKSTARTAMLLA